MPKFTEILVAIYEVGDLAIQEAMDVLNRVFFVPVMGTSNSHIVDHIAVEILFFSVSVVLEKYSTN